MFQKKFCFRLKKLNFLLVNKKTLKISNHSLVQQKEMNFNKDNTIVLFDVDGTLAESMKKATPEMFKVLSDLRQKV
jgi:hypothetical protein